MEDFVKGMVVGCVMVLIGVLTETGELSYNPVPESAHLLLYTVGLLLVPVAFYYFYKAGK